MEFLTRKAVREMSSREVGKKRARKGDSSATTPPLKVPAIDTSVAVTSSAAPEIPVSAVGIVAEATVIPSATAPAAAPVVEITGGKSMNLPDPTSVKSQVDNALDLELSLRQKRIHDLDIADVSKSNENVKTQTDVSKEIDTVNQEANEQTAKEPGGSSTLDHQLNLMRLADRMLAAIDEQSKALEEQKKDMQRLLGNQMMVGAAAGMTQGAVYELRTLMSRSPYRGTLNWAFCGLMVVARLGYLTPHILEDPVIQILLGEHVEELRHVINSVLPYHHSIFLGSQ